MNLPRFQVWCALALLVTSCNDQSPSGSGIEKTVHMSIPSLSGPNEWNADPTSNLTLFIRERLFGIWKTTQLDLPLTGRLKLDSDGGVFGMISGDLRQIRSDEKRRDEYLLGEVFTSEASGVFSCSTQITPDSEVQNMLPLVVSGTCSIMGTTNSVTLRIDHISHSEAIEIRGSSVLSLDAFGVPDISQEPVVKVARQAEARFLVRLVNGKSS